MSWQNWRSLNQSKIPWELFWFSYLGHLLSPALRILKSMEMTRCLWVDGLQNLWIKALQEVWRDFYESFTNDQTQEGPGSRKPANPKNNPIFCKIFLSIESI